MGNLLLIKYRKLLNLGSILYHLVIDIFKTSVAICKNNQGFLSVDLKVHPKKKLLQAVGKRFPL